MQRAALIGLLVSGWAFAAPPEFRVDVGGGAHQSYRSQQASFALLTNSDLAFGIGYETMRILRLNSRSDVIPPQKHHELQSVRFDFIARRRSCSLNLYWNVGSLDLKTSHHRYWGWGGRYSWEWFSGERVGSQIFAGYREVRGDASWEKRFGKRVAPLYEAGVSLSRLLGEAK